MVTYAGKLCLAPMVRSGEIANRLLSLKYGADLVWTPEYVDKKIIRTKRIVNDSINTIDYIVEEPTKKAKFPKVIFRTSPQHEKGKLIFQLGTADPKLAVEAASKVIQDVDGIDLNCGCPKPFSTHSGMGAALLSTPDLLCSILTELIEKVGKPNQKSISCKIRLMDDFPATKALIEQICATGIDNLTIHCRTRSMRNRQDPVWTYLTELIPLVQSKGISLIINGNIQSRADFNNLQKCFSNTRVGAMIAECAEANPSVFSENPVPINQLIPEFHRIATKYNYDVFPNTKFLLLNQIPGKSPFYQLFSKMKTYEDFDKIMENDFKDGSKDPKNLLDKIYLKDLQKVKTLTSEEYQSWMSEREEMMKRSVEESLSFTKKRTNSEEGSNESDRRQKKQKTEKTETELT